ncbi:MAG: response regulator [Gammaproteobacteria bacterium]|nr:response regulator [Gammaproteobacteria bacterium]
MIRVLLVDDHDLVRMGIKRLISDAAGIQVVGEAATGEEGIELAKKLHPDVILMDISPEVAQQLALKHLNQDQEGPFDGLSERELQVMIMITSGQDVQEIAEQLCLSPKTVNSYRYRLFEKLGIDNDVEMTHLAIKHGLIQPAL